MKDEALITFKDLVNKMTNHEHCVWSRAGFPGLRGKDIKELRDSGYAFFAERKIKNE